MALYPLLAVQIFFFISFIFPPCGARTLQDIISKLLRDDLFHAKDALSSITSTDMQQNLLNLARCFRVFSYILPWSIYPSRCWRGFLSSSLLACESYACRAKSLISDLFRTLCSGTDPPGPCFPLLLSPFLFFPCLAEYCAAATAMYFFLNFTLRYFLW